MTGRSSVTKDKLKATADFFSGSGDKACCKNRLFRKINSSFAAETTINFQNKRIKNWEIRLDLPFKNVLINVARYW